MFEWTQKHYKSIKIILIIVSIILSLLYLKFFFQKGILYDDVFLIEKQDSGEVNFHGKSKSGHINIEVKGDYNEDHKVYLDYRLPNNINKSYIVEFDIRELGYNDGVKILDDEENLIFDGSYIKNSDMIYLLDESEEMIFPDSAFYFSDHKPEVIYDSRYEISLYNIMDLATRKKVRVRGDYGPFIVAVVLSIITIIDIKYPLFFFELNTFINVRDAKPSDFYLVTQKIGWYVQPVISLILFIIAIV